MNAACLASWLQRRAGFFKAKNGCEPFGIFLFACRSHRLYQQNSLRIIWRMHTKVFDLALVLMSKPIETQTILFCVDDLQQLCPKQLVLHRILKYSLRAIPMEKPHIGIRSYAFLMYRHWPVTPYACVGVHKNNIFTAKHIRTFSL